MIREGGMIAYRLWRACHKAIHVALDVHGEVPMREFTRVIYTEAEDTVSVCSTGRRVIRLLTNCRVIYAINRAVLVLHADAVRCKLIHTDALQFDAWFV